jgi:hypothetical protein
VLVPVAGVLAVVAARHARAAVDDPGTPGFSPGAAIFVAPDADLFFDMDRMKSLGATWIRLDFLWASIEATRGTFNWTDTDRLVAAARMRGLRVVGLLHTTPTWARAAGTTSDKHPPTNPDHFATFARQAVSRYAADVKVWEVWNEPNISPFWQPRPDPVAYTALLKKAHPAIHAAAAGMTVLSAGLSPAVDAADGSQVAPLTFLRKVYQEGGKGSFEAVAMHPYSYPALPTDPTTAEWNTFLRLPEIYDLMVANGDGAKKIWMTEIGAPTGTHPTAVSQAQQAAILADAHAQLQKWPWAGPMLWYAHRDAGTDLADREQNFGIRQTDFSAKQAVPTYQQVAGVATRTPGPSDFNGDGRTDIAVFRPTTGTWFVRGGSPAEVRFGVSGDVPVPGDYNGDGRTDIAVFRPLKGIWYFHGGSPAEVRFGAAGDVPVPGDYNGDGKTDIAVFRPATGTWFIRGGSPSQVWWGTLGDVAVPGDYNGDGKTDIAVYRPATGTWFIRGGSPAEVRFGGTGDRPVPGDYNGDGKTDIAVFRPATGTWFIRGGSPSQMRFGVSADLPVPGDYDGDGKTDIAVFRPATGAWFVRGGNPAEVRFGVSGDVPLPDTVSRALPA